MTHQTQPKPVITKRSRAVLPEALEAIAGFFFACSHSPLERSCREYLETRIARGVETYGQALSTHNCRDALEDARQEIADAVLYLTQAVLEAADNRTRDAMRDLQERVIELLVDLSELGGEQP